MCKCHSNNVKHIYLWHWMKYRSFSIWKKKSIWCGFSLFQYFLFCSCCVVLFFFIAIRQVGVVKTTYSYSISLHDFHPGATCTVDILSNIEHSNFRKNNKRSSVAINYISIKSVSLQNVWESIKCVSIALSEIVQMCTTRHASIFFPS